MLFQSIPKSKLILFGLATSLGIAGTAIGIIQAGGISFHGDHRGIAVAAADQVQSRATATLTPSVSPSPVVTTSPSPSATAQAAPAVVRAHASKAPGVAASAVLTDADVVSRVRSVPQGVWLTGYPGEDVGAAMRSAASNSLRSLVVYNLPGRDCGGDSAGGASGAVAYKQWIDTVAPQVHAGTRVIIEPDALGHDCSYQAAADLVQYAVAGFKAHGARVYIDASQWVAAGEMANRLTAAGLAQADGFSLNVSNFLTTSAMIAYGHAVSRAAGGKHFVIDVSRNGNGPVGEQWCNPPGRALGTNPTVATGDGLVDGLLWIKNPGESDGVCADAGHHDPAAGTWWPAYALGLARAAGW